MANHVPKEQKPSSTSKTSTETNLSTYRHLDLKVRKTKTELLTATIYNVAHAGLSKVKSISNDDG